MPTYSPKYLLSAWLQISYLRAPWTGQVSPVNMYLCAYVHICTHRKILGTSVYTFSRVYKSQRFHSSGTIFDLIPWLCENYQRLRVGWSPRFVQKLLRDIISRRCLAAEKAIAARTTEIHVVGKRRTFVRLSRVKLDSQRHCVRSPARIASTRTTCLFSLPFSFPVHSPFRHPLYHRTPLPPVLWLATPSLPTLPRAWYPFHRLTASRKPSLLPFSLTTCLLLTLSLSHSLSLSFSLFLFFFLYASWFARYATEPTTPLFLWMRNDCPPILSSRRNDEPEHDGEMRASAATMGRKK